MALFPPGNRGKILQLVLQGNNVHERYMLYGIDRMILNGFPVKTNLNTTGQGIFLGLLNRFYKVLARKVIGSHGEISWITPVFTKFLNCDVIFSFSEKCIYPVLFARYFGIISEKKIVLVSIGLSEKFQLLTERGELTSLNRLLREVGRISKILTFSWQEKCLLKDTYNLDNVEFIPLGVDVNIFKPAPQGVTTFDVVSVGADKNRDFDLLVNLAKRLRNRKFLIITSKHHAEPLIANGLPDNVELKIEIPIVKVCDHINSSTVVFLPVKDNLYSGATTCLVQAMSLEKAVITSRVNPISEGYGFEHGKNLVFVEPGNIENSISELKTLLSDYEYRMKLEKAARSHVETYLTLENMTKLIYQQLAEVAQLQ